MRDEILAILLLYSISTVLIEFVNKQYSNTLSPAFSTYAHLKLAKSLCFLFCIHALQIFADKQPG